MSDVIKKVEELDGLIQEKRSELDELYKKVNLLIEMFGVPHDKYVVNEEKKEVRLTRLKGDEYFRRPMATVITLILQDRKSRNMGPATLEEIYEKMLEGGYVFDVKEPKIAVGTGLGKNSKFTKIGDNKWGLTEWYPKVKESRNSNSEKNKPASDSLDTTNEDADNEDNADNGDPID